MGIAAIREWGEWKGGGAQRIAAMDVSYEEVHTQDGRERGATRKGIAGERGSMDKVASGPAVACCPVYLLCVAAAEDTNACHAP